MPDKSKLRELTTLNQVYKEYEQDMAEMSKRMEELKQSIYDEFIDEGIGSVSVIDESSTKIATVFLKKMRYPTVQDMEKFGSFIKQHGLEHLFKIHPGALMGFVNNELAGIDPAAEQHLESIGLTAFDKHTVVVRRA